MNYAERYYQQNKSTDLDCLFESRNIKTLLEAADDQGVIQKEVQVFSDVFLKRMGGGKISMVLSTMDLDRDGERLDSAGWDLRTYLQNPVILWHHDQSIPSLGRMENLMVQAGKLTGIPKFDKKEVDEFSFMIGEKLKSGSLSTGSVGFKARKVQLLPNASDGTKLIIREAELFEFSICNVPANPSARVERQATAPIAKVVIDDGFDHLFDGKSSVNDGFDGFTGLQGEGIIEQFFMKN